MINIPDITMCTSEKCPEREKCYRVQAKASEYQSWFNFEYECNEESCFCEFLPLRVVKHNNGS